MQEQAIVVEDNPVVRMQIADILADLHMSVTEADSAEEALALFSGNLTIGYLVTDVGILGTMDGLTLAETVIQRWPGTRIVIATGRDLQKGDVPEGAILIRKPFAMRGLEAALGQAEEKQQARREP